MPYLAPKSLLSSFRDPAARTEYTTTVPSLFAASTSPCHFCSNADSSAAALIFPAKLPIMKHTKYHDTFLIIWPPHLPSTPALVVSIFVGMENGGVTRASWRIFFSMPPTNPEPEFQR